MLGLKSKKPVPGGVCTDVRVTQSSADMCNRDYLVEIPFDCVAAVNHKAHKHVLQHMEQVLGDELIQVVATTTG